ncbi:hypothetical protein OMO38_10265 [Chryseobacterium sp. 09-1422]|uniref:Uncharacterized protein n=1 Tax=Chryseobacterium kimseyorum TaxID=2984028 RepID=A0ABT3HYY1_9FLAO|nr:hypothetical protein [Chryseobacterium kimseyorum]MCW3168905.1 hypothetical protein [Chryseobacterium kimseyorum]
MIDKKIQEALAKLKNRKVETFPAKIISVDKTEGTCVINDGDIEFADVALSASIEENGKRFHLFPKVGSFVLVSPVNEDLHRLYIEFFSEIESVDLNIAETQLQIDKDGFLLKKENETLKKMMDDFLQACRNMVFQTNAGITIELLNDVEFKNLQTRFNQFLK